MDRSARQITTEVTAGAASLTAALAFGLSIANAQRRQDACDRAAILSHNRATIRRAVARAQARHDAKAAALRAEIARLRASK